MRLTTKIVLKITIFLVFSFLLFANYGIKDKSTDIKNHLAQTGNTVSATISYFCIEPLLVDDYPAIETHINSMLREFPHILAIQVYHGNTAVTSNILPKDDIKYKKFINPIKEVNLGEIGKVVVYLEDNTQSEINKMIFYYSMFFLLLFLLLWVALVLLIKYQILNKIQLLSTYSNTISNGNYDEALNLDSKDELSQLANNLTSMSKEIDIKHKTLTQLNRELEESDHELQLLNENLMNQAKEQTVQITEQKEAFENLYQKSTDGVLLIEDGKFIDCNESVVNMLKYKNKEQFLKVHPSKLSPEFQPDGKSSFQKADEMMQVALDTGSHSFEWIHTRADGEDFWAEIVLTKMVQNGKDIIHTVWRDISKRKQTEFELEKLTKHLEKRIEEEVERNRTKDQLMMHQSRFAQMGEMISMIAHQWRQPLNAISLTSSNIQFKLMVDDIDIELFKKEMKLIDEYSQHLSKTIDDFRGFFKENKQKETTTLRDIVNSTLDIVRISVEKMNIKIVTDFNCNIEFETYSNEVKQVILNLIKNAEDVLLEKQIKQPQISIKTRCENHNKQGSEQAKVIIIKDNAGGIPEDIMAKIFDPYFSTKKEKDGTGLGLYMSKIIIEDHCDGKLSVSNDTDGAVFKIEFK